MGIFTVLCYFQEEIKVWIVKLFPNFMSEISGKGAFGAVFRHVYNNRDVAIKQFHPFRHSSSHFHSFCSELNAFRLPPSPHVVQAVSFTSSGCCLQVFLLSHLWYSTLLTNKTTIEHLYRETIVVNWMTLFVVRVG